MSRHFPNRHRRILRRTTFAQGGGGRLPGAPIIDFSWTPSSGVSPVTVTFTDLTASTPTTWLWKKSLDGGPYVDFEGTPTVQNPVEVFTGDGVWAVSLTAGNLNGAGTGQYPSVVIVGGPTVTSRIISASGLVLTVDFSEPVTDLSSGFAGFTVESDSGVLADLTYTSGGGTSTLLYAISRKISEDETVTMDYTPGTIESVAASIPVAAFADAAVTNNSTVAAPTISSATVDATGLILTVVFSEDVVGHIGFQLYHDGNPFNNFYDSGETTDTLIFDLEHTVLDSETITLDYSPGDIVSDTTGAVLMPITAMAVTNNSTVTGSLLSDTFTDTDTTLLDAHTMDMGPGWELYGQGSVGGADIGSVWTILSNRVGSASVLLGYAVSDAGETDATVTATLAVDGANNSGVIARFVDVNNWIAFTRGGNLYVCTGVALNTRDTSVFTPGAGDTYEIEVSGADVIGRRNGVDQVTYTLSGGEQTALAGGTKFGLLSNSDATGRFDAFEVTA